MWKYKLWKKDLSEFIFVTIILIIFLYSSLSYIYFPGLTRDEGITPFRAVGILIKNDFSISELIKNVSFSQLMADPIMSSIFVLLYSFIFYFFGVSVFVIRFVSIFFGLIFLLFFYFFVRSFFNKRIAMLSLVLLSTLPTLVFYIKISIEYYFLLIPGFGCLLFFWKFYKKRKLLDLNIGSLFLGLGFYWNILFWWFFFALIIAFLVLRDGFHFKKKELIVGFIFFLIGTLPMILWNLNTPFERNTISYILANQEFITWSKPKNSVFNQGTQFESSKPSFFSKVQMRFSSFHRILSGNLYEWKNLPIFMRGYNFLNWWFFVTAFIFAVIATSSGLIKKERKKLLFLLTMITILFLESTVLSWSWGTYQLLILIPFCIIISANLLDYILKYSKIFVYALLALIVIINLLILNSVNNSFASGLRCSGVFGEDLPFCPSSNIYSFAEYLQKNQIRHLIFADFKSDLEASIGYNLGVLTLLKVEPYPLLSYEYGFNKPEFLNNFKKGLFFQNSIFLVSDLEDFYKFVSLTEGVTNSLNKTLVINKTFYLADGTPEFVLFQAEDLRN